MHPIYLTWPIVHMQATTTMPHPDKAQLTRSVSMAPAAGRGLLPLRTMYPAALAGQQHMHAMQEHAPRGWG